MPEVTQQCGLPAAFFMCGCGGKHYSGRILVRHDVRVVFVKAGAQLTCGCGSKRWVNA